MPLVPLVILSEAFLQEFFIPLFTWEFLLTRFIAKFVKTGWFNGRDKVWYDQTSCVSGFNKKDYLTGLDWVKERDKGGRVEK